MRTSQRGQVRTILVSGMEAILPSEASAKVARTLHEGFMAHRRPIIGALHAMTGGPLHGEGENLASDPRKRAREARAWEDSNLRPAA